MRKPSFLHMQKHKLTIIVHVLNFMFKHFCQICAVVTQLIRTFVLAAWILQIFYFLNPNFQASSHLLWLHSLVCVGPVKPKSHDATHMVQWTKSLVH